VEAAKSMGKLSDGRAGHIASCEKRTGKSDAALKGLKRLVDRRIIIHRRTFFQVSCFILTPWFPTSFFDQESYRAFGDARKAEMILKTDHKKHRMIPKFVTSFCRFRTFPFAAW
jgi:hypothetical protein